MYYYRVFLRYVVSNAYPLYNLLKPITKTDDYPKYREIFTEIKANIKC